MAKKGTAARRGKPRSRKRSTGRSRWLAIAAGVVLLALLSALPVYRAWWRRAERTDLSTGLARLDEEGCLACHRDPAGCFKWRADGRQPASTDAVRDAVLNGRPAAEGFPGAMPPYAGRLRVREWQDLAVAVAALAGIAGEPEDQELAAGRDIVTQMGCERCHGPLGARGIPNPGTLTGRVPGWYGPELRALLAKDGALEAVLRDGSRQRRTPMPGVSPPPLAMPAYGGRLDSVELDLLVRYLEWLHDNPPSLASHSH